MAKKRRNSMSGSGSSDAGGSGLASARRRKVKQNADRLRRQRTGSVDSKRKKIRGLDSPTKLRNSIGLGADILKIRSRTVETIDRSTDQDGYQASFWNREDGRPALFLNKVRDLRAIQDVKSDVEQMTKDTEIFSDDQKLPAEIFIKAEQGTDIRNIRNDLNETLNPTDGKSYIPITSGVDGLIRLVLKDAPPAPPQIANANRWVRGNIPVAQIAANPGVVDNRPPAAFIPLPGVTVPSSTTAKGGGYFAKNPKNNGKSESYQRVLNALDDYNNLINGLTQAEDGGPLVEGREISEDEFQVRNAEIQRAKENLRTLLTEYSSGKRKLVVGKSKSLKEVVARLQADLDNDNTKGVNKRLDAIRANGLIEKLRPLTDSNILHLGQKLGAGAQGDVFSVFIRAQNERGEMKSMEVSRKFNGTERSDGGARIDIPKNNPQEAERAVATYEGSRFIGLNIVPRTFMLVGKNPKTGENEIGHLMDVVPGVDGQKKVRVGEITDAKEVKELLEQKRLFDENPKDPRVNVRQLEGLIFDDGRVFDAVIKPVDIDYKKPVIQKELADQQLLDIFIGHGDRHPGNWRYLRNNAGDIVGVRTVDNDDSWGKTWSPRNGMLGTPTPSGAPPIVDAHSAIGILKANPDDIPDSIKRNLSEEEVNAAADRLRAVQSDIIQRIKDGDIAIMPNTILSDSDKQFLRDKGELDAGEDFLLIRKWGENTFAAFQPKPNGNKPPVVSSYLAIVMDLKSAFGTAPAD